MTIALVIFGFIGVAVAFNVWYQRSVDRKATPQERDQRTAERAQRTDDRIQRIAEREARNQRKAAREPLTDLPPWLYSLASGSKHDAYTAPVHAVTPGGIPVRRSRCCPSGHQSPAQAQACAGRVAARIERTGR